MKLAAVLLLVLPVLLLLPVLVSGGQVDEFGDAVAWPLLVPERAGGRANRPMEPLSDAQVEAWREGGAVLVDGVLDDELVRRARAAAVERFPEPVGGKRENTDFGSGGDMQLPTGYAALDEVVLYEPLLGACAQLLGVQPDELRLTQADVWEKTGVSDAEFAQRGPLDNLEQRMHVDYLNHNVAHPSPWERPDAVALIVYYDDTVERGGGTGVVLREGADDPAYEWPMCKTPGCGALPWINDAEAAEAFLRDSAPKVARWREEHLYAREKRVQAKPGTILFYRHDTWHRGTRVLPGQRRRVHNLVFKRQSAEWHGNWNPGWATKAYAQDMRFERLIAGATVLQRTVLGFPRPDSPYWNQATLAAVETRYGPLGFRSEPYRRVVERGVSGAHEVDRLREEVRMLREEVRLLRDGGV